MSTDEINYDEFEFLEDYAARAGIPWQGQPTVVRKVFTLDSGERVSGLLWGDSAPQIVFLHGRGQNAHTWDTVAMALGVPLFAVDLPGHGHSDWREDHDYRPETNAAAVMTCIRQLTSDPVTMVGMSMGGHATMHLTATNPDAIERVVIVDITPGDHARAPLTPEERGPAALIQGPTVFDSFDEMLDRASTTMPGRSRESLRPGVLHNARQLEDGRWAWRYDPPQSQGPRRGYDRSALWDDFSSIAVPIMLVKGGASRFVTEADLDEARRRQPSVRIEVVDGANHSVQSTRPMELSALIADFLANTL